MPDQPSLLDLMLWARVGFASISLVLIGSGAAKILDPSALVDFLSDGFGRTRPDTVGSGVKGSRAVVGRAIGAIEILLGLVALSIGGRLVAVLVAVVYGFFSVIVAVAIRRGSPSCGCFGAVSSPPRPAHLVMNLSSVVLAGVVAVGGVPAVADLLSGLGTGPSMLVVTVLVVVAAGVIFVDTR